MKISTLIKFLGHKLLLPKPWLTYISTLILVPIFTTPQKAALLLTFLFILDFITGIIASWIEFQNSPSGVTTSVKRYVIESSKLRLSAVKFICYALGILCAWGIEIVFVIKKIPSRNITTEDLSLTTFVIAFFCAIEFYSVFFENIKRMGFDIIQKLKKIISEGWKLYNTIKNNGNG